MDIDIDIGIKVQVEGAQITYDAPKVLDIHEAEDLRDKLTAAILEVKAMEESK